MTKQNYQTGFALLYAILISGAVLSVGVILMNIITQQLIYSSINRNSDTAYYYAANSGRECLNQYASGPGIFYKAKKESVVFLSSPSLFCFGQPFSMTQSSSCSSSGKCSYSSQPITLGGNKVELSVTFNSGCLLHNQETCNGSNLDDKSMAVMKAVGYSGSAGGRATERVAILVQQSL